MHGGGEEEALVQAKMDPCFYKMALHYVASVCKFGADLTCFSVPIRSLAGWVLVAMRCCGCKPVAPLLLLPLPLPWCAHCLLLLHYSLLPLTFAKRAGELAGRVSGQTEGATTGPRSAARRGYPGGGAPWKEGIPKGRSPLEIRPQGELN